MAKAHGTIGCAVSALFGFGLIVQDDPVLNLSDVILGAQGPGPLVAPHLQRKRPPRMGWPQIHNAISKQISRRFPAPRLRLSDRQKTLLCP